MICMFTFSKLVQLLALQLFKPRPIISNTEFVWYVTLVFKFINNYFNENLFYSYQHNIYNHLLNRYLEHKYQDVRKAMKKAQILNKILNSMDPAKEILLEIFMESDPNQLALVINEIFNLKKCS